MTTKFPVQYDSGVVEVISKETIKPSSSKTSHHKNKLKFSYIDQLLPPVYIPLIFLYQPDHESRTHSQISQQLKQSLSDCLSSFYPLAGRVKNNYFVNCNDAGVEFVDARVHARLTEFVREPDIEEMKQLLPLDPSSVISHSRLRPLLLLQVTFFDCGGIAVGACFSHKVVDFASAVAFLKEWSVTCRGEARASEFSFGTSRYFPPSFLLSHPSLTKLFLTKEKRTAKRFVFSKEKLELLKQLATSESPLSATTINDPTRVELVSAFIWKCFIEVAKSNGLKKRFYAFHAVNVRTRVIPPQLLENVFGNCAMISFANTPSDTYGSGRDIHGLVGRLRRSIRRVRGHYITKPLNKESVVKDLFKVGLLVIMRKIEWCFFSSWCGFSVYEVDYGWGKPICFSTTPMPGKNLIILVNSRDGDGIEALVTARQDVIDKLDGQFKLIFSNVKD